MPRRCVTVVGCWPGVEIQGGRSSVAGLDPARLGRTRQADCTAEVAKPASQSRWTKPGGGRTRAEVAAGFEGGLEASAARWTIEGAVALEGGDAGAGGEIEDRSKAGCPGVRRRRVRRGRRGRRGRAGRLAGSRVGGRADSGCTDDGFA